jgi:hypothetical protein
VQIKSRPVTLAVATAIASLGLVATGVTPASATTCVPGDAIWSNSAKFTGEPYPYPGGSYYLNNNQFGMVTGSNQTMWLEADNTFGVCSYQPTPNTVKAFPGVNYDLSANTRAINSYTTIQTSFAETNDPAAVGDYQYMADMFANNTSGHSNAIELEMISYRHESGSPPGTKIGTATLNSQKWDVYQATAQSDGHTYYAFILQRGETSGQDRVLGAFQWLSSHAGFNLADPFKFISEGWEISDVNDGGTSQASFTDTSWSVTLSP